MSKKQQGILLEKYRDITHGLNKKYEIYKKFHKEGKTLIATLELMHYEIVVAEKELSKIREEIRKI